MSAAEFFKLFFFVSVSVSVTVRCKNTAWSGLSSEYGQCQWDEACLIDLRYRDIVSHHQRWHILNTVAVPATAEQKKMIKDCYTTEVNSRVTDVLQQTRTVADQFWCWPAFAAHRHSSNLLCA